jgi:hypothetical protein
MAEKKLFLRFKAHIYQMRLFRAREEEECDSFNGNDSLDESDHSSGKEETY